MPNQRVSSGKCGSRRKITPLHLAVLNTQESKALIRPDPKTVKGVDTCLLLVEAGANVTARTENSWGTPLELAKEKNYKLDTLLQEAYDKRLSEEAKHNAALTTSVARGAHVAALAAPSKQLLADSEVPGVYQALVGAHTANVVEEKSTGKGSRTPGE
jgi:hypothetical protein